MSSRDELIKRVNRLEKGAGKGRFLKLLPQLAEQLQERRLTFTLISAEEAHLYWEAVCGKDYKVKETALRLFIKDTGTVSICHHLKDDSLHAESDLIDIPPRKFGKFLHKFGLIRKIAKGYNTLGRNEYEKGKLRLVEYGLEFTA